ncbi:phosphoribosyltransferase family protein [Enterococcus sp.]|uniref:phosphoribosyltransferase family protein n=1 Tax=Enterococcus sp. TaxID=35783 RepID=UPI00289D5D1D|nr:phosphoribosyltransferase family protein [Enterococcus sp.]
MRCNWCMQMVLRDVSMLELLWPLLIPTSIRCHACEKRFARIDGQTCCPSCGKHASTYCSDCQSWASAYPGFTLKHRGIFAYNEGMKDWLHQYKLMGDFRLREVVAADVKKALKTYRYDCLIPIPLSADRYNERGFNQVIAVLDTAAIAYQELLLKPVSLVPLATLSKLERMAIQQPFSLVDGAEEQIKEKRILLIDDVYTSGRTLYHAAELIHSCQPASIESISFAR